MNPRHRTLVEAIRAGIASRDFYIVPTVDQIPGCSGNREKKLECVRQFARDNGWHVTIHCGNGWLLFTGDKGEAPKARGGLGKLIERSLSRGGEGVLGAGAG